MAGSWENVVNWIAMLPIKLIVGFSAVLFSELIHFALTGAISTEIEIFICTKFLIRIKKLPQYLDYAAHAQCVHFGLSQQCACAGFKKLAQQI